MRKKVFGRQFSRSRKAREALFKSLISALILHGRIETTYARAKAIRGDVDEVVRLAKNGSVSALREIASSLSADREIVAKLTKDVSSFKSRTSGFTRTIRLPARYGDAAEMVRIEWVDQVEEPKKEPARQGLRLSSAERPQGKKVSKTPKPKAKKRERLEARAKPASRKGE